MSSSTFVIGHAFQARIGTVKTTANSSDSDDSDYLPELVDSTDYEVTTFYQGKFSLFVYWPSVSNNRYCLC